MISFTIEEIDGIFTVMRSNMIFGEFETLEDANKFIREFDEALVGQLV